MHTMQLWQVTIRCGEDEANVVGIWAQTLGESIESALTHLKTQPMLDGAHFLLMSDLSPEDIHSKIYTTAQGLQTEKLTTPQRVVGELNPNVAFAVTTRLPGRTARRGKKVHQPEPFAWELDDLDELWATGNLPV